MTRIRGGGFELEIGSWREMPQDHGRWPFADGISARTLLRWAWDDPTGRAALRRVAHEIRDVGARPPAEDDELLEVVARCLGDGRLWLRRVALPHVPLDPPRVWPLDDEDPPRDDVRPVPEDPPWDDPETKHWIGFRVVDFDTDEPAAGIRLRLVLPDGRVATYRTDADGVVHLPDIPEGECELADLIDDEVAQIVGFA